MSTTVLVWDIELTITSEEGRQIPAMARRLREVADSLEKLPPNLIVGAGQLPNGGAMGGPFEGLDAESGWKALWHVGEKED